MPRQISIQEAIARIKSGADGESFSLDFIVSSGKRKGERARRDFRYGAPSQEVHTVDRLSRVGRLGGDPTSRREHVERGTIPLTDVSGRVGRYKTVLISHIIGYNQFLVRH